MKKLLFEAKAPVRADVGKVRALIDGEWVLDALLPGGTRSSVDVDRAPGTVDVQGHWWYRGEISAVGTPAGTELVHRVFSVARRGAWAVPLANRFFAGFADRLQRDTEELTRRMEARLRTG